MTLTFKNFSAKFPRSRGLVLDEDNKRVFKTYPKKEMKKYIQTDELKKIIDWDAIMRMPRYAGGHDEQMQGLFKGSEVIGHWNEGDYQGMVATCVKLPDGHYAIYNDYYGSCSGCDSWEDAGDDEVRAMCINLANGAYVFETIEDVKEYLGIEREGGEWSIWRGVSSCLLNEINNKSQAKNSN